MFTNYDQQQHYKDRGPTWIKLYNRLLDDYGFAQLPDAAKWHLIGIFLLASRHNNRIPADPAWLARDRWVRAMWSIWACWKRVATSHLYLMLTMLGIYLENRASPEKKREEKTREEKNILSAGADTQRVSGGVFVEGFEDFWSGYPTDALMSKKKVACDLAADERPVTAPRRKGRCRRCHDFIGRQKDYRVLHAWKFLSERRFEGFTAAVVDPAVAAAAKDRADRLLKRGKYAQRYE